MSNSQSGGSSCHLTLATQVLRVPSALALEGGAAYVAAESRTATAVAADAESRNNALSGVVRDTIFVHPMWMERFGWQCDDTVIVCKEECETEDAAAATEAGAAADATTVQLQAAVCRVWPLDPSLHAQHWSATDLSVWQSGAGNHGGGGGPSISFRASLSAQAWRSSSNNLNSSAAIVVPLPGLDDESTAAAESVYRAAADRAREEAYKPAPPPPPSSTFLSSGGAPQTPVKKQKAALMMLPPSSAQQQGSSPVTPRSASAALAAAARLNLRVLTPTQAPRFSGAASSSGSAARKKGGGTSADGDFFILSLRNRTGTTAKASRIVLQPLNLVSAASSGNSTTPPPSLSAEAQMELAAMLKRHFHRCCVCAGVVLDVRSLAAPEFQQQWKHLRVVECSPDGELCQITRGTQVLFDLTPPSSSAPSTALTHASTRAKAQSVHPALQALYALLLPPLLYPGAFTRLCIDAPRGLLLSGPPGVGKTYSVRQVCMELGVELFVLDGAALHSGGDGGGDGDGEGDAGAGAAGPHAGAAEQALRDKFAQARKSGKPAVLFIDEIDVLCPDRSSSGSSQLSSRLVAQLLSLMDGLESRGHGLLVVGATNHPNALDAALRRPGRFDRELRIEPPTVEQREDILRFYTRDMPLDPLIDLNALAQRCIGFVGADLAALVREAATHALRQYTKKQRESTSSAAAQQAPMLPSISWSDFEAALLVTPASSLRGNGALARKSTTSFAQIGGLSRVKQQLRQALEWPLQFGETFRVLGLRPPRGIVLYGPPGCAKTTLVRAMAASTSAAFLPLDTARLYSCFVGEAERILRALFSRARANRPCVLFLDEIDAMVHKRGMTSSSASASGAQSLEARILSTLLNEMDGMQSSAGVLVVAATNRLDLLDEALLRPGRFDNIVYVPPPDAQARTDILRVHAARMLGLQQKEEEEEEEEEEEAPPADADAPVAADARQGQPQPQQLQQKVPAIVSAEQSELEKDLAALGAELEGYTGADIANLCREAALTVLRNDITNTRVTVADLRRAAAVTGPSLTPAMIAHYASTGASSATKERQEG